MAPGVQRGLAGRVSHLIDEAATAAVVGPARPAGRQRHLLQHDRRLSERRGSQAGRPVGGRGRALDASPGGRRLPGHLPRPSRRAQDAPRPWSEAEQEARQACEELERFGLLDAVGYAQYAGRRGPPAHGRPGRGGRSVRAGLRVRARRPAGHGAPAAGPRRDRGGRRVSIGRALAATAGSRGTSRPSDSGSPAPGPDRHRAGGRRPGDRGPRGRRAGVDRRRLPASPSSRPARSPARGELLLGEDRPSEASPLLGRSWRLWQQTRPALRERPGAPPLRRGDGGRGRPGERPPGPAGGPRRVRAARREARSCAGRRAPGRGGAAIAGSCDPAGDQDVHVHRHRHLDRPGRADRR